MPIIDITGIDKAYVLLHLYNYAIFYKRASCSREAINLLTILKGQGHIKYAQEAFEGQAYFESIDLGKGLRVVKVDLKGSKLEVNEYDEIYGEGQAQMAIHAARQSVMKVALNTFYNVPKCPSPIVFTKKPSILNKALSTEGYKNSIFIPSKL